MQVVPISEITRNPANPRIIKDERFAKLVQSLKDFPEMANVRPIVVNKDMVILGGNMRFRAMKEAKWKEVPVEVVDWSEEKQREFIIKDNVGFGEWDLDMLANEWDTEKLTDWGLGLPIFNDDLTNNTSYEGLDQLSKLDKFLNSELKRMFLVYDNETFENVISWFNELQQKHELENHSQVILKLMENENI
jgi:hypothetical protein